MKKLFILFLVGNFYNMQASQERNPSLPDDMQNLSIIVHASLNQKNQREFTFRCSQDTNGKKLHVSAGLIDRASYYLTYPEGSPELQAVIRTLPDHHNNPELKELLQIVKLERAARVIIMSNAPQFGW
jgi:hypothetical protein